LLNLQHLKNLVNTEIIDDEDKLIAIKKNEYEQGDIYSNGKRRTYALDSYKEIKRQMNPRADGFVDLIFSGSFINSFLIIESKTKDKLIFKSTDSKYELLGDKYNNSVSNIYNLDQEVFDNFLDKYVKKDFIKAIKQELGQ